MFHSPVSSPEHGGLVKRETCGECLLTHPGVGGRWRKDELRMVEGNLICMGGLPFFLT